MQRLHSLRIRHLACVLKIIKFREADEAFYLVIDSQDNHQERVFLNLPGGGLG
ncbi:MAG: hypothetical protein KME28_11220 [Pelatocladus maniniholoensis HA4357-MV3]|uniref:Uncharacterized protein n=1 Tax=Pelatocladus maniniholoensis HA4357-MV3 TaxID=1117104 RepID=A0A9E3H7Y9_9NOST|nr:hypothetical protein [Pelatocladus maniniholoensis HA4357-MV3]BAZ66587.1 hypothetical protein NIES4106_13390 [Fischerella sp. NIES-4106]